jgi:hypothetical protein
MNIFKLAIIPAIILGACVTWVVKGFRKWDKQDGAVSRELTGDR